MSSTLRPAIALAALLLVAAPIPASAQSVGEAPEISLLMAEPLPDGVLSMFGHSMMIVRMPGEQIGTGYTYTVFPEHLPEFLKPVVPAASIDKATMQLEKKPADTLVKNYQSQGRAVVETKLILEPEKAWELAGMLANTSASEGHIAYDIVKQNCSTRFFEMIDEVLDGRLANATNVSAETSVREISKPYMHHRGGLALWWLLTGPEMDREITIAETSYLPIELQSIVKSVEIDDGGLLTKLAGPSTQLNPSEITPVEARLAPASVAAIASVSIMAFAAIAAWGYATIPKMTERTVGSLLILLGVLFSAISIFIMAAWSGSMGPHLARNQNLLLISPILIFLIPSGILLWLRPKTGWLATALIGAVELLLAGVALAITLAWPSQHNGFAIMVAIFGSLAMIGISYQAAGRSAFQWRQAWASLRT